MDIERQKEFLVRYEELVKEYNMKIVAIPQWRLRDDGSYSMYIDLAIGEIRQDALGNNIPRQSAD